MATTHLFNTLIERKLLTTETLVLARVPTRIFGGGFVEKERELHWHPGIPVDCIREIEGMPPERFAKSYDIKPDGTVKIHKKRGRKPKNKTV